MCGLSVDQESCSCQTIRRGTAGINTIYHMSRQESIANAQRRACTAATQEELFSARHGICLVSLVT